MCPANSKLSTRWYASLMTLLVTNPLDFIL